MGTDAFKGFSFFSFSFSLSFGFYLTFHFLHFHFNFRTICEVAATPGHSDGLFGENFLMKMVETKIFNCDFLGEIMNVVFSASSSIGEDFQDLLSPEYR